MGAGTLPTLEVMKLRGRPAENFPEVSWLVRRGGPSDLALRVPIHMPGDGCTPLRPWVLWGGKAFMWRWGVRGAEQIWNPRLKAPAPHPSHDPCGWSYVFREVEYVRYSALCSGKNVQHVIDEY